MKTALHLLLTFGSFLTYSCENATQRHQEDDFLVSADQIYHYELKNPDQKYFLPYVLEEISGLGWKSPNALLAVDDETGKVFEYSLNQKEIIHSITFYHNGDFEGVEFIKNHLYVLRSDGNLFKIKYTSEKKKKAEKIETALSKRNDTEGLGYDPEQKWLLIACKEKAEIGDKKLYGKAFYAFDLQKEELKKDPLFTIGAKDLKNFWEGQSDRSYDQDRIKFKPSAIGFHPISKNYYILSAAERMVLVVTKFGEIQASYPISPQILSQPEGIAFAPNGDMYISSEGKGNRGFILKFKMKTR